MNARVWIWRIVLLAVLIGGWYFATRSDVTTRFFFGSPVAVAQTIGRWFISGSIYKHLGITLLETVLSFVIGTSAALAVGLLLALNGTISAILDPFIKGLNTMPRLILAPMFAVWFGLGIWSKVALAVTLVFFIVFFNVYQGIREVNPVLLANARMLGANQLQLMRRVYVPAAMTWVFSSLHVSVGMAFVGTVIGEYLGSAAGVGYLIQQAELTFDINSVLAGIITLTICALLLDGIVTLAERRLLRWREGI
jgi:NitT/TauT family transport system permease protein